MTKTIWWNKVILGALITSSKYIIIFFLQTANITKLYSITQKHIYRFINIRYMNYIYFLKNINNQTNSMNNSYIREVSRPNKYDFIQSNMTNALIRKLTHSLAYAPRHNHMIDQPMNDPTTGNFKTALLSPM